jgi:hypothetical protein
MVSLTPVQFATDRIIIVNYPVGAGGKFIMNSLALSQNSVLPHQNLTALTSEQKLDWLCNRYESMNTPIWRDLDLGCIQLFGNTRSVIDLKIRVSESTSWQYSNVIPKLIEQNKYFFVVAHNSNQLAWLLQTWPNAKIIRFVNYLDFMQKYRPGSIPKITRNDHTWEIKKHIVTWWKTQRAESWPIMPPLSLDDYQLPEYQKIKSDFEPIEKFVVNHIIQQQYDLTGTVTGHRTTDWDASCYLDQVLYLQQLKILYNKLGLADFDADKAKQLYTVWVEALTRYRNDVNLKS